MTSNKPLKYSLALPLAVFGFLLIIATGTSMLLSQFQNKDSIPLFVSIIGLIFLVIAIILRNKEKENT